VSPERGVIAQPAWSPDGKSISYTLATPNKVADLHVIPSNGGDSRQLTFSMPAGNVAAAIVEPEKVKYRSADGLEINAYLYKPRNLQPGQRAPAIVWSHGGPAGQYHDAITNEIQLFVQRGYVALAPNFRGSSGYGKKFQLANAKCWGHCDLQDILAGVDYLKALPYVDPNKLGITGNSYGGFMTCAAVAFAPGVFHAAIGRSGYCNRYTFMAEGEYQHLQQLEYSFGPFATNEEVYKRNSPFYSIKAIQTPLFLIHGEGKFPESKQYKEFADEMQRHYKTFRYKAYPNENYYIYRRDNVRQMWLDMLEFFNQYLPVGESRPAREVT
jgi:dipeptidyl aminopeptidase/acylaminoacyl peptidase